MTLARWGMLERRRRSTCSLGYILRSIPRVTKPSPQDRRLYDQWLAMMPKPRKAALNNFVMAGAVSRCQAWDTAHAQPAPILAVGLEGLLSGRPEIARSALWANPNVVYSPGMCFFSNFDGDPRTGKERGEAIAGSIIDCRDTHAKNHPGVPFHWVGLIQRTCDGIGSSDLDLFYHRDDRLSDGTSGPFTANGRALHRRVATEAYAAMKAMLDAAGVPAPLAWTFDEESECGMPQPGPEWQRMVFSDRRAAFEPMDGVLSFFDWIKTLRDFNGQPIPESQLWSDPIFGPWELRCLHRRYRHTVVDYAMHDAHYSVLNALYPGVPCGNFVTYGAPRTSPTYSFRPNESPVDLVPHATLQLPCLYGNTANDPLGSFPDGQGADTFTEQSRLFGLDPSTIGPTQDDRDNYAWDLHIGKADFVTRGCELAKPGTASCWITWKGAGVWEGPDQYSDSRFYPKNYLGARLDYNARPDRVKQLLSTFAKNNVRLVPVFAQGLTGEGCERMAATLAA